MTEHGSVQTLNVGVRRDSGSCEEAKNGSQIEGLQWDRQWVRRDSGSCEEAKNDRKSDLKKTDPERQTQADRQTN